MLELHTWITGIDGCVATDTAGNVALKIQVIVEHEDRRVWKGKSLKGMKEKHQIFLL